MVFRGPNWVELIQTMLPLFGMLGTVIGIFQTFDARGTEEPIRLGFATAIGTTAAGLFGKIVLIPLSRAVIFERKALLKTVLVIFNVIDQNLEKRGGET